VVIMIPAVFFFLGPLQLEEKGAESLDSLVSSLEKAFAENDLQSFLALHFWDRCPEVFRESQKRAFSITQPLGLEILEIVAVDETTSRKLAEGIVYRDMKKYVPNLRPVRLIMAKHGSAFQPQIPVGVHDGRFFVCMFEPEES